MCSISRHYWIVVVLCSMFSVWMVSSTPIYVVQNQPAENFEWALVLPVSRDRTRRHVPDGYFDEFSADPFSAILPVSSGNAVAARHRRAQPILDKTDEFSADPFEIPVLPETALIVDRPAFRIP